MLWLKEFTPELNFLPTKSISEVSLINNAFILNKKLGNKSFLNTKRKRAMNFILKHLKSKSRKGRNLRLIKSKNVRLKQSKDKKVRKVKVKKKLKRFVKLDKFARRRLRWLKSYRRKKLRKNRRNRFKRRRWFLRKKRNKHFKSNKKLYRKKLLKRLSFRIHKKVFRKRISFSKSKNIIKNANKLLLNKFFLSINSTEDSVENILANFGLFRLKNYMLRSSSYLKMTQEEKMAYLDKLNLPKAERERLLSL